MDTTNLEPSPDHVLARLRTGIDAAEATVQLAASAPRSVIEEAALSAGQLLSEALRQADIHYVTHMRGDANG